jgi:hypothetical protein
MHYYLTQDNRKLNITQVQNKGSLRKEGAKGPNSPYIVLGYPNQEVMPTCHM